MNKYYTWTDQCGYFKGQDLLSRRQIQSLLGHLNRKLEAFATIQDYDQDGNIIGCPVYFDIDSPSLYDAYADMLDIVFHKLDGLHRDPAIWFSGSKGFHVVTPVYIRHPRCHDIVRMIAQDEGIESDMSVYRTRSMWRCNNTYNEKGDMFKVRVESDMSLESILRLAEEPHDHAASDYDRIEMPDDILQGYVDRLPSRSTELSNTGSDFVRDFMPCMRKLWESDSPPDGYRHHFLHMMARHCFRSGLSLTEATKLLSEHHLYSTFRNREYIKVISSVYRSGNAMIGCGGGKDGDLLRQYCTRICGYNKEYTDKLF